MGLKVNVSEQEATSGDREPLPIGKYHMAVTEVRLDSPKDGDNVGKPMLVFEFTVQDSDFTVINGKPTRQYTNRKDFVNACCWEGALYTIVGILKAMGQYESCLDASGELDIPSEPEFYLGTQMFVRRAVNKKSKERNPDNPDYWVQAQGFSPFKETAGASAGRSSDASLLP